MPASSPDRGRRPQVRGGSFPDPASAPEGPSGIRSSGLKPSRILHRRVFALRHTSVLNTPENLNSAIPDAKERCSQAPAFPFGCFQYSAPAARGLRKCGAVRLRPSTVPVLCPAKPGLVLRVWPACLRKTAKRRVCDASRAAYARIGQPTHQSAQRGRSGARKSSRCTVRQEPASHHGTNRLIRGTVRRSTAVGNAVPFRGCPQLLAGGRTVGTSLQPCAGPGFRPRRPFPLHLTNTADAGPELTQTVACAGAGVLDDSCGALPEHQAGPGQRSVPVFSCVGRYLGGFRGTMIRCLRRDPKLGLNQSIIENTLSFNDNAIVVFRQS